jgi:hypothetical protein
MLPIILSLFSSIRQSFRTRAALQAEILALRHQLLVLRRSKRDRKLRLGVADRLLWVSLSRLWSGWRSALVIVKPETVIAWHRRGFRVYWSWKSRHPQGRLGISREVIDLIRTISLANPRWGAPRIHGELLKLGFELSEATVAKYMAHPRRPTSQTWRTFLANHRTVQNPLVPRQGHTHQPTDSVRSNRTSRRDPASRRPTSPLRTRRRLNDGRASHREPGGPAPCVESTFCMCHRTQRAN